MSKGNTDRLQPGLDDSFGFLVCDTARFVKRVLYARLAPWGIPGSCWFLFRVLWQEDGISQRELSGFLGVAEPSVVVMLRGLEKKGLIRRERDEMDLRKMRVFLTERAIALEKELMAVAEEVNHTMLHALSSNDEKLVKESLRSIRGQLSAVCEGTEMVDG
jgi:DNA-binding MarR family transcriptional regulator